MLSIIGLEACVNVVHYKAKVIVLEHSHTIRDKCMYTCVISDEHEKRLGVCRLYRGDEPPKTSPEMIMKIFSERLRKVYVGAHGWNGTLDMTDVFSRTTAVEKGKEKVVVVREKCADCGKLFERKELLSDSDKLYCDPCGLRLDFNDNDVDDVINGSGPHHPQNDVVDADTARKIHRKQTTSQNDKVIAEFAAEDFEARKELKKSKERVSTFKLAAKKVVYRGLQNFFEEEEEEEKEEKPDRQKKCQGKHL